METKYKNESIFLILNGVSFSELLCNDSYIDKLYHPYIMTMGVNNSVYNFRPNLWVCSDNPKSFLPSIWYDATITKYARFNENDTVNDTLISSFSNVNKYECKVGFENNEFLSSSEIFWGKRDTLYDEEITIKSTFLIALKILYLLGFTKVYLLGCDFYMEKDKPYHFDEKYGDGMITHNNKSYILMDRWFNELQPYFLEKNFQVFNCNEQSRLTAFPYCNFLDAIEETLKTKPVIENENTLGMYVRRQKRHKDRFRHKFS